jgi:hypothetical protein
MISLVAIRIAILTTISLPVHSLMHQEIDYINANLANPQVQLCALVEYEFIHKIIVCLLHVLAIEY